MTKERCIPCENRPQRVKPPRVKFTRLWVRGVPLPNDWKRELQFVLDKWKGTPFMRGGSVARKGACCYGFLVGVLDELHGFTNPPPYSIPPDIAYHAPKQATRFALKVVSRYASVQIRPDKYTPEPGDVLFIRVGHGVGHAMIVGSNPNQLWHADGGTTVGYTGFGVWKHKIVRAFRSPLRHTWQRH